MNVSNQLHTEILCYERICLLYFRLLIILPWMDSLRPWNNMTYNIVYNNLLSSSASKEKCRIKAFDFIQISVHSLKCLATLCFFLFFFIYLINIHIYKIFVEMSKRDYDVK